MAIPAIASYPLPGAADLPGNTAPWRIDPSRAVVIVHDLQHYFVTPFAEPLRSQLVGHVADVVGAARAADVPVRYTAQPGSMTTDERGLLADFWGAGMSATEAEREILDEVAPADPAEVHLKWRYSAFARNRLLDTIRELGRDQIVLCGIYAHVGVLTTAIESFSHDLETFLVADAIADFSESLHRQALDHATRTCSVVLSADETVRTLSARPAEIAR